MRDRSRCAHGGSIRRMVRSMRYAASTRGSILRHANHVVGITSASSRINTSMPWMRPSLDVSLLPKCSGLRPSCNEETSDDGIRVDASCIHIGRPHKEKGPCRPGTGQGPNARLLRAVLLSSGSSRRTDRCDRTRSIRADGCCRRWTHIATRGNHVCDQRGGEKQSAYRQDRGSIAHVMLGDTSTQATVDDHVTLTSPATFQIALP